MVGRRGLSIAALALTGLVVARLAAGQTLSHLFESKDHYTGPVAKKVAEFKESFVVGGVAFNADGTQIATNGMVAEPEVHIWDWRGHSHVVRVLQMNTIAGDGSAIRYNPDGTLLAVGHLPERQKVGVSVIRIWDTRTGQVVHDLTDLVGGGASFAFTGDGNYLIRIVERGGHPGAYVVADRTDTWDQVWGLDTLPLIPRILTVSPDGRLMAVAGERSTMGPNGPPIISHPQVLIVDLSNRQVIRSVDRAFPDENQIHALAWSPDGRSLAAGAIVGGSFAGPDAVKIFDVTTGTQRLVEPGESAYVTRL